MFDFASHQDVEKVRTLLSKENLKVYMAGIGGVGMCALALHLLELGVSVSGCDRTSGEWCRILTSLGIPVMIGEGELPRGIDALILSLAIPPDAPVVLSARRRGIPVITRPRALGALMLDYPGRIGVSGTHGKSSTVAMLHAIYRAAGRSPTVISGAALPTGLPYAHGCGTDLIYEACEYRDAFLSFSPTAAVITSCELDHTDYFGSEEDYIASFTRAANSASQRVIINSDDGGCRKIEKGLSRPAVRVGRRGACEYIYTPTGEGASFYLSCRGRNLGLFTIPVAGGFFSTDAALAAALAIEDGVGVEAVRAGLAFYRGIPRRLELIAKREGRDIYYDYAHHPTEIRAVISALRAQAGCCTAVFCPHTYTRTAALWDGFVDSLRLADHAVLVDVYAAREEPLAGVDSRSLAAAVGGGAVYLRAGEVLPYVMEKTNGPVILMGAGDLTDVKRAFEGKE